ncbi:MAG TPA: hypothetical protein VID19_11415 [Candidatus Eremiobacteraceae bacterium]|jgi:hypothetical protein
MNDPTSRRRAPLIPTISTLDDEKPVAPEVPASEICQRVCVVVVTIIDIGSEPLKPS